jgi:hypothetical protein
MAQPPDPAARLAGGGLRAVRMRLLGSIRVFVGFRTVENNTRSCRAAQFGRAFSGMGIALLGARDMEVKANRHSGHAPSGLTPVSGGVVVATDAFFGGAIKPRNNTVTGNDFGRNRPDIRWDGTGTGNVLRPNNCDASIPARLCS